MSDLPLRRALAVGALAGVLAGVVLVLVLSVLRLVAGVSLPTELVADRILPHVPVVDFVELLGRLGGPVEAKRIAFVTGFLGLVAGGVLLGIVYALLLRRRGRRAATLVTGAATVLIWAVLVGALWPVLDASYVGLGPGPATAVTAAGLLLGLVAAWAALPPLVERLAGTTPEARPAGGPSMGRGAFLTAAGGAALFVAAGGLVEVLRRRSALGYDGLTPPLPLEPITPNDQFYVVTKNIVDPSVRRSLWRLRVEGAVERPRTWSFDELAALPAVEEEITLECISNTLGGGLMSNAVWRGVPLPSLLEDAGPRSGAAWVSLGGVDGYAHSLRLREALQETTLVAYEMNGEPLPDRHGYPARALVPGTYGEVSVKWIEQVVVMETQDEGYYETQGWEAFEVDTGARIDRPRRGDAVQAGSAVRIEGVAFAGARGIQRVEVSTDGGETWEGAEITYGRSRLAWSLWRHEWTPEGTGRRELVARAVDGTGSLQPAARRGVVPDGASGYHRVEVTVAA